MYSSSSSGQFSTASTAPSERRDQIASQLSRGVAEGHSSTARAALGIFSGKSEAAAAVTTPSAYLTYAGVGASTNNVSASYLPSIIDNNNIEESFVDISAVPVSSSSPSRHHQQSGFVPPVIDPIPREPLYSRDQTQPQNLSLHRGETGNRSEAAERGRARDLQAVNNIGPAGNDNNNRASHNNNLGKISKGSSDSSHVLRNIHPSNDSMVTSNAAMSLQNQLANWHIPGAGNNSPHHQPHQHHGGQTTGLHQSHHLASAMMSMSTPPKQQQHQQSGPRRHTGPRPAKNDSNLSPEEAERRRVRRERNKLAAAKCRKRRMDHTAQLQEETEELESVQREIHNEILNLQQQKEQLEFILQAHKVHCKRGIPFSTLPPVRIPSLTLPAPAVGDDGGLRDELASNLSNDSLSSTTSNHSPAPASLQMQMTTTTAAGAAGARPTNSSSNNGLNQAPAVTSFSAALNIAAGKETVRFGATSNSAAVTAAAPTMAVPASAAPSTTASVAAANRPTSLPIIVKQEPPFIKVDPLHHQQQTEDVKPEAMDISVTQATGVSISTPKVSPRVLSLFDVIDHTGLTPITGGGVITSVGSASNTPISSAAIVSGGEGGYNTPNMPNSSSSSSSSTMTPPTTKMGTPNDRNNAAEKPSSGQTTLMSL